MDNLLTTTLAAAVPDVQTVTKDGMALGALPHGVTERRRPLHLDSRGSLQEVFSNAWDPEEAPLQYVYMFSVRPGCVKGWGLHKLHDDRYFLISGEMLLVLYDVRPDSPTCGKVATIMLSEQDRRLVTIPAFVWHADHNIGTKDAVLINMPTRLYDSAEPDKYRLPVDTPLIPYSFGGATGG